jgi:hypothetical protein
MKNKWSHGLDGCFKIITYHHTDQAYGRKLERLGKIF